MCDHKEREAAMTTVAVDAAGKPTVWCDPCLAPLVKALNDGGISTVASCCGHGTHVGSVALSDGRWIVVMTAEDWANFDNRHGTVPAEQTSDPKTIPDDVADAAQLAFHEFVWGAENWPTKRELGITRQAWKCAIAVAIDKMNEK